MKKLTNADLHQVVAQGLWLVEFYGDHCMPCQLLLPILEKLSQEFAGKVNFGKIEAQSVPELVAKYQIMTVPTMILYVDGVAKEKVTGYKAEAELRDYLNQKIEMYG